MPPKYHLLIYLRVNTRPCDSFNKYIQATKDKIKIINRDIKTDIICDFLEAQEKESMIGLYG